MYICTFDEWRTFSRFILQKVSKISSALHFAQFNFSVYKKKSQYKPHRIFTSPMQYPRICKIILLWKQFLWAQDAIYVRFCHDFPIFLNKAKPVCLDFYKNLPKHHSNLNFSRIIIFKLFSLPYIDILETKSEFFFINYVTVS